MVAPTPGELGGEVLRGRRRWLGLVGTEGVLACVGVGVAMLAAGMLADWKWEWPRGGRAAWLGLVGAGILAMAWRYGRRLRSVPGVEWVALLVEARRPELRSRLISALQLGRRTWDEPDAAAFVNRLRGEAGTLTQGLDWKAVFPSDRVRRMAWRVLPVLGLAGFGLAVGWPTSGILLRRALLEDVSVPRRTRITETSGQLTVGRGDDVVLWGRAEGVLPRSGQAWVRMDSGREQRLPLDGEAGTPGRYARTLANVMGGFTYRLRIHDSESDVFRVEVLPRPVVNGLKLTQVLPRYTGLPARTVVPGELALLRGSRLRVEGTASAELKSAVLRLTGLDTEVRAEVGGGKAEAFAGEIAVQDTRWSAFEIGLEDVRGIRSKDPAVYAVEVVPDLPPQVRMLLPTRREELVTARGTVLMSFEARDDYGMAGARVRHQPVGATNVVPGSIDLDWAGETNLVARRRFEWRLSTLVPPLSEGALYEFWVEATDRNDVDGPGVGRTDRFLLRVVSEAEKRADLLSRAGDAIGRLGDVAEGQERLNESLGRIILAKPAAP